MFMTNNTNVSIPAVKYQIAFQYSVTIPYQYKTFDQLLLSFYQHFNLSHLHFSQPSLLNRYFFYFFFCCYYLFVTADRTCPAFLDTLIDLRPLALALAGTF